MLKDEFVAVVKATSEIAEVETSAILSDCRLAEVVEARVMAIKILNELGYSTQRISKFFHKTEPGIRGILASYDDRMRSNPLIVRMMQEIKKKLQSN